MIRANPARALAFVVLAAAVLLAVLAAVAVDGDVVDVARGYANRDDHLAAIGLWWVVLAPAALFIAVSFAWRGLWPWAPLVVAHAVVATVAVVRVDELHERDVVAALVALLLTGVLSVVSVAAGRSRVDPARGAW
ncbi:hypothetical protein [Nocardioides sp.]|uniref:hypothetical protein n=1 Tax=Nocardioides sp. TaxID=35761 RepID=UPI00351976C6